MITKATLGAMLAIALGAVATPFVVWQPSPNLPNRQAYQKPSLHYVRVEANHDKNTQAIAGFVVVRNMNANYSGSGVARLHIGAGGQRIDGGDRLDVTQSVAFNGISDVRIPFSGPVPGFDDWAAVGTFTDSFRGNPRVHNVDGFRRSTEYDVSKYGVRF